MSKNTLYYKSEIEKNKIKELEEAKRLKEQEEARKEQLLIDKAQEIVNLKELLAQKEEEVREKSFVKNQVINELQEDVGLKEQEAYKLQIELLTKQLESANVINELKDKLLTLVDLHKKGEGISKLELSVIHHRVEESILSGKAEDISELSKYLDEFIKQSDEKYGSVELSKLLDLVSIPYVEEHKVVINNDNGNYFKEVINSSFDNHATHSSMILLGEDLANIQADGTN